jgi:hypothetical protein
VFRLDLRFLRFLRAPASPGGFPPDRVLLTPKSPPPGTGTGRLRPLARQKGWPVNNPAHQATMLVALS